MAKRKPPGKRFKEHEGIVYDPDTGEVPTAYWKQPKTVGDIFRWLVHSKGLVIDRHGVIDPSHPRMRYGGLAKEGREAITWANSESLSGGEDKSAENAMPRGAALAWLTDVSSYWDVAPGAARHVDLPEALPVAHQLARLAGDEMQVTIPQRSLADAVGRIDRSGNLRQYTENGVKRLQALQFIEKTVTGSGRGAKTTYKLLS